MAQTTTAIINKPSWVELSTPDAEAGRPFYARIFAWQIDMNPEPQYGAYAQLTQSGCTSRIDATTRARTVSCFISSR